MAQFFENKRAKLERDENAIAPTNIASRASQFGYKILRPPPYHCYAVQSRWCSQKAEEYLIKE